MDQLNTFLTTHHQTVQTTYLTGVTATAFLLLGGAITAFISPVTLSTSFGLPLTSETKISDPSSLALTATRRNRGWIVAWASREFALSASILALRYLGEFKALAVLACMSCGVGWGDSYASWKFGVKGSVLNHLIPTLAFTAIAPLGVWLYVL